MKAAGSRIKGSIGEREVVKVFLAAGIKARRVPLSGAAGGYYSGDVIAGPPDDELRIEVKRRASGFKRIYDWLQDNAAVVFRGDRKEWLVCLRLEDLVAYMGGENPATQGKARPEIVEQGRSCGPGLDAERAGSG